jgi:predicted ATPase/DNA-binding winged helix-turn-helix (wHTH) protein
MPDPAAPRDLAFDRFVVQPAARRVLVDGVPARLGARAFDLLLTLIERRDRLVSKNELLDLVWPGLVVEENNLQVHISALRKLLGPTVIATIPGRGYRFAARLEGTQETAADPVDAARIRPRLGNLPEVLPTIHGRAADVRALLALVEAQRVVSVVGAGGIGKTRLAQAAAHALRDAFADGVWMVELAPVVEPDLLPAAVAQALGLALPGRSAPVEESIDALRGRALLLVLDNCEHLVEAVSAFVEALMERAPRVRVLATSQELLKVNGEHLYRLGALALPPTPALPPARSYGAVALFVDRVGALQPGFELTPQNVDDVIDICRRLDGLPLAIELAAARVPLLGVSGVHERLHERFRMLTGGARVALRRHQTLRETLDWSHGLLGADERAVLRRAGVFAGGFTWPAARQVLADGPLDEWAALDHLGALVDKSLLVADSGTTPRYRLLESTRAYALEKLREAGETDATLHRHARAMLALFEAAHAQLWTVPTEDRLERWLPDLDNLRAALDHAQGAGEAELQIALAGASAWIWGAAGQRLEGLRRCEQALAQVDATTPPPLEARLQLGWSQLAHPRSGVAEHAAAERAVELFRALGDRQGRYVAAAHQAVVAALMGDLSASERAALECRQLHDSGWPPASRWHLLNANSFLLHCGGRYAQAHAANEECLRLAVALGDTARVRAALLYLEQTAQAQGLFEEAAVRGRELVAMLRRDRFGGPIGTALGNLGAALTALGQLDDALAMAREAAALEARAGALLSWLDAFALLAFKRGRVADAALALGRAEAGNRQLGFRRQPNEQRQRDELLALLRETMQDAELQQLMQRGAALSDEEAARIALAE